MSLTNKESYNELESEIKEYEEFLIIQENEITRFLSNIHDDISTKKDVYFSIGQLRDERMVHKYFKDTKKAVKWIISSNPSEVDTYFTVNEFNCPQRKNKYVYSFKGFYFDLDLHDYIEPKMIEQNINLFMDYLSFFIRKKIAIMPSCLVFTGRGLHLYYILDKGLPRKKLDWLYNMIADELAETLKEVSNSLNSDLGIDFNLDSCYKDFARFLRVPVTLNTKVNCHSEIIFMSKKRYSIQELREFTQIDEIIEEKKTNYQNKKKDKPNNIKFFKPVLKLHNDRLADLIKLIELRENNLTGYRELILFLIRYYNCFINIVYNDELIRNINNSFTEPLKRSELRKTKSAEKAYHSWILAKESGYNYQNKTLIRLLGITEEEQIELKTIISKDEKKRRRSNKKQWSHKKRDNERKTKKEEIDSQIKSMLLEGRTYREISQTLNVSKDRVGKVKKRSI